jgi:hypothetical protein
MATEIQTIRDNNQALAPAPERPFATIPSQLETWLDPAKFAHMQRIAQMFAQSDLVPPHFQNKVANCSIVLHMAYRMNIDPMMAFQNMHVVHGNPGISAQLGIALANQSGIFVGPITFVQTGTADNLIITAKAKLANGGTEVSTTVSYKQAMDAGWPRSKDGLKPFWKAMPEQMLKYRAATFLIRTYAPQVLLGMHTAEEWEDQGDGVEARSAPVASLAAMIAPAPAATPEPAPERPTPRQSKKAVASSAQEPVSQPAGAAATAPKPEPVAPVPEDIVQGKDDGTWEF